MDKDETEGGNRSKVGTGREESEDKVADGEVGWEVGKEVVDWGSKVGRSEGDIVVGDTVVEEGVGQSMDLGLRVD